MKARRHNGPCFPLISGSGCDGMSLVKVLYPLCAEMVCASYHTWVVARSRIWSFPHRRLKSTPRMRVLAPASGRFAPHRLRDAGQIL